MKNYILLVVAVVLLSISNGWSKESIDPTISPSLFTPETTITVTYDVTGTSLANLTNAFAWVWIPGGNIDASYNVNPASTDVSKTNIAKFTKSVVDGRTYFTLTFVPADFFLQDISDETQFGILLKGNDWSDGQTSDYITDFWDGSFQISLTSPLEDPLFVNTGEEILITAETPVAADFSLYVDNQLISVQSGSTTFSYNYTISSATSGVVKIVASANGNSTEKVLQYLISTMSTSKLKPSGIIPGINYNTSDASVATLCLWAPGKESVYVIGDFTAWKVMPEYMMYRDGEYFWLQVSGLTAGEEYAFQYLVDEAIYIADPYADKILDPDDQYIPESVYPALKEFPAEALKNDWYFNRLSVLQTAQPPYDWTNLNYEKPAKQKLVVYELLIRDFFSDGERSYKNLIDTLSYFKTLGINAIEIMPIMEFNGNDSWGYNPTFMFAPDKYYGDKNMLKAFVDECHKNNIAVILDIALNHQDIPNAYLMMDFDFSNYKPQVDNKWFNVEATHPFNVFYDMNHESLYTKTYIDTINHYWLNEYKIDGFRFDLSKGFTQVNNPNNVEAWSAYDASRIAILKRMADKIWDHSPDAYVILEHLAVNNEEKELAEYRAEEGKGMMLWGKMTEPYNQLTMGYPESTNMTGVYYESRGWTAPHLVSYMESHDEERLMYKNIQYGNESTNYSVKDTLIALQRQLAVSTLFYTIPGPKMLWQFGELGYDYSINHCEDGSNSSNCRVSSKPVRWDYFEEHRRKFLYNHTSELIKLRNTYDVFSDGRATITSDNSLVKQIQLKNDPYVESPSSEAEMNAVVVANLDLVSRDISVNFPHAGTWYDYYFEGAPVVVTGTSSSMNISPGGYRIFTDFPIEASIVTSIEDDVEGEDDFGVFPNPIEYEFNVADLGASDLKFISPQGLVYYPKYVEGSLWQAQGIPSGLYILQLQTRDGYRFKKIIKKNTKGE